MCAGAAVREDQQEGCAADGAPKRLPLRTDRSSPRNPPSSSPLPPPPTLTEADAEQLELERLDVLQGQVHLRARPLPRDAEHERAARAAARRAGHSWFARVQRRGRRRRGREGRVEQAALGGEPEGDAARPLERPAAARERVALGQLETRVRVRLLRSWCLGWVFGEGVGERPESAGPPPPP